MEQLELELEHEEYWKKKYDDLMVSYIRLEGTIYALRTSIALLKGVVLEWGEAG